MRGWLAGLAVLLCSLGEVGGQRLCPGSRTAICNACPDQCAGSCFIEAPNHIKCPGASWGNTNSTYMGLACSTPPGDPPDRFPLPAITSPALSSPLACNGTIRRGQWPFDADNSTFTLDTTFRDPLQPSISINTQFLPCLQLSLRVKTSIFLGQAGIEDALSCTLPQAKHAASLYAGLDLEVCQGTDVSTDSLCTKGMWNKVVTGVCLREQATGIIQLEDTGGRVLVRVGGGGDLTGCQPTFNIDIQRDAGLCSGLVLGFGSCCTSACFNSRPLSNTSCICNCPAGFVGQQCDKTATHAAVTLIVFNATQIDWFAADNTEIGNDQPLHQFLIRQAVAEAMRLPTTAVEFASAETIVNNGTGAGGQDGVYLEQPTTRRRKGRDLLQVSAKGCAAASGKIAGAGLSRVRLRVIATFEHDLSYLKLRLEDNLLNGTVDRLLRERGLPLCTLDTSIQLYNEFGFLLADTVPTPTFSGLSTENALLIVFAFIAGAVVFGFACLQYVSNKLVRDELTKHLRTYKTPVPQNRLPLAWRYVSIDTEREIAYPRVVSDILEEAYKSKWIRRKQPLHRFVFGSRWYTADFAQMKAFEDEKPTQGLIVKVVDAMTYILDASASSQDAFFNGRTFKITHLPDGSESRMLGQDRAVHSYVGASRELKLEAPLIPPPVPGSEWAITGSMSHQGAELMPPGISRRWYDEYRISPPPGKEQARLFKQWQKDAHALALLRLDKEIHFPAGEPLPPSATTNVTRLHEIREEQRRLVENQRIDAQARLSKIGKKDEDAITTFSGAELRGWQYALHENYARREREKLDLELQIEEEKARNKSLVAPLTIDNHEKIIDEVMRREIFAPGSQADVLREVGLHIEDDPRLYPRLGAQRASSVRLHKADEVRLDVHDEDLGASPSRARQRGRGKKLTLMSTAKAKKVEDEDDEYYEEVAV